MNIMKVHAMYASSKLYQQRGLSLIELMISLTIGMLLLLGITALIVQQSQTRTELEKSSRQIENGRYAMQILHDDIEHAGYYDKYFNIPQASAVLAATPLPDPCSTVATDLEAAMSLPVQGYNLGVSPPTGAAFTCKLDGVSNASNANNHRPGTDILVIRRVATNITPKASAVAGQYYLQATPAEHLLATGTNTSVFTITNNTTNDKTEASLRAYMTRIYFISPCSIPAGGGTSCTGAADDDGRPIPTLKRLDLSSVGGAPTFTMTRLVEGIENMQLDYGLDADLDGYPDNNYATVPATSEEWSNVMTVRVNLLARNTECTTGHTDTKSYNLGAAGTFTAPASICPNGDFKRHVFTELVRVINPSGRRSQE